jgi:hypothetical protein
VAKCPCSCLYAVVCRPGVRPSRGVPFAPIATDTLGRPVFANEIFDPLTRTIVGGVGIANPFPTIPSVKLDQLIDPKQKLSFYYQHTRTDSQFSVPNGSDNGLPTLISTARGTFIFAQGGASQLRLHGHSHLTRARPPERTCYPD